jgi:hypothetical protein
MKIAGQFSVRGFPTVIAFIRGQEIARFHSVQTHASASIEVSPNMNIGTCEDLNCKFIQFHISSKESIPKTESISSTSNTVLLISVFDCL